MPTVLEIVADYLRAHGHDGLCNPEIECGCGLGDLAPCGDYCPSECVPAVECAGVFVQAARAAK